MRSREFIEWLAYARLEPFEPEADDYRMAQLMALIANVNRDPKRRKTPWTPNDFLPRRGPRPETDQGDLRPRIDAAMAAFGGRPEAVSHHPAAETSGSVHADAHAALPLGDVEGGRSILPATPHGGPNGQHGCPNQDEREFEETCDGQDDTGCERRDRRDDGTGGRAAARLRSLSGVGLIETIDHLDLSRRTRLPRRQGSDGRPAGAA